MLYEVSNVRQSTALFVADNLSVTEQIRHSSLTEENSPKNGPLREFLRRLDQVEIWIEEKQVIHGRR